MAPAATFTLTPTANQTVPSALAPMAFLEPAIAIQVMNGTYMHMGVLAVMIWDLLHNAWNDYILSTKHRFRLATGVYFFSRLTVLVYALGRAVLLTLPIENCRGLELAIASFLTITLCLNTFLFYVRICAVFFNYTSIVISFGLFWSATIGMACIVPTSMSASHIGPTRYCLEQMRTHHLVPTYIVFFLFDTLVFVGTSYRFYVLFRHEEEEGSIKRELRIVFLGASMPAFSKAMLHENQLYYLGVPLVKLGIIIGALCFKDGTPGLVFVSNLVPVHVVLANVVTCRVFRNTKLGLVREPMNSDVFMQTSKGSWHVAEAGSRETVEKEGVDGCIKPVDLLTVRKEIATITVTC
ncbi:unnamed protein product [Cyclocybe aegerita]|uniref:Transmembrane protein n=1 Tax=Cyclocybe aegerita TaxID=1973307 RepID=A0A8S0W168_CYCAE|nr:unnamed protein product [Cyclocybe aegerita]